MKPVVIENPILNSPYERPTRYFKFDANGEITNEVLQGRRPSSYFIPIAEARRKVKQPSLYGEPTPERGRENDDINHIRDRVDLWRRQGRGDITPVTRSLLEYWTRPDRERELYYCQIEALETVIYLTEAAERRGRCFHPQQAKRCHHRGRNRSCPVWRARRRRGAARRP